MMYLVAPTEEFNEFDYNGYSLDYTKGGWYLFDDYSDAAEYVRTILLDANKRGNVEEFVIIPLDTDETVDVSLVHTVSFNGCIERY